MDIQDCLWMWAAATLNKSAAQQLGSVNYSLHWMFRMNGIHIPERTTKSTGAPTSNNTSAFTPRGGNKRLLWIVSSAFGTLVIILTLVTFIGEAVRESFDPKKFTIYQ